MTAELEKKIAMLDSILLDLAWPDASKTVDFYKKEHENHIEYNKIGNQADRHALKKQEDEINHHYQLKIEIAILRENNEIISPEVLQKARAVLSYIRQHKNDSDHKPLIERVNATIDVLLKRISVDTYVQEARVEAIDSPQSDFSVLGKLMAALGKALIAIAQGVKNLVHAGAGFFKSASPRDVNEKPMKDCDLPSKGLT